MTTTSLSNTDHDFVVNSPAGRALAQAIAANWSGGPNAAAKPIIDAAFGLPWENSDYPTPPGLGTCGVCFAVGSLADTARQYPDAANQIAYAIGHIWGPHSGLGGVPFGRR